MKEKTSLKMFIIGFVACAAMFLLMGASNQDEERNRYQISSFSAASGTSQVRGWSGYYIVDTHTGKVIDSKFEKRHVQQP
jgi:hypothetical protein